MSGKNDTPIQLRCRQSTDIPSYKVSDTGNLTEDVVAFVAVTSISCKNNVKLILDARYVRSSF